MSLSDTPRVACVAPRRAATTTRVDRRLDKVDAGALLAAPARRGGARGGDVERIASVASAASIVARAIERARGCGASPIASHRIATALERARCRSR
jgi:hypothetical protein